MTTSTKTTRTRRLSRLFDRWDASDTAFLRTLPIDASMTEAEFVAAKMRSAK